MLNFILGKKIGVTQVFTDDGECVAVTVISAGPCCVIDKKTVARDGYDALQLGLDELEFSDVNRPLKGHFQSKNVKPHRWLQEVRVISKEKDYQSGDLVTLEGFKLGDLVDVSGVSKGHGFQGVIKRHHKAGGPKTHGSRFHRSTGSIGQRTYPGKVFKNMKLPGHMGNKKVTVKNLKIVSIRADESLIFVKGSIPGPTNSFVLIKNVASDFYSRS